MSQLSKRSRRIVREGEMRRATFTAHGKPAEIYRWWHEHTKRRVGRENFCHYWRVVAIWAPLMFVRISLARLFSYKVVWVSIALIIIGLLTWGSVVSGQVLEALFFVGIVIYAVVSVFVAALAMIYRDSRSTLTEEDMPPRWLSITALIVCAPAVAIAYLFAILHAFITSKPAMRFYRWMVATRLGNRHAFWLSPLYLTLTALALILLLMTEGKQWWLLLTLVAFVVIVEVGKVSLQAIGNRIEQKRIAKKQAERLKQSNDLIGRLQPIFWLMFKYYHPKRVGYGMDKNPYYVEWQQRYMQHAETHFGVSVWGTVATYGLTDLPHYYTLPERVRNRINDQYYFQPEQQQVHAVVTKKTIQLKTPFVVMADFLVLIAQVIRVNKWRICPLVEIPNK